MTFFPLTYENNINYFKLNTSVINSENKQIKLFLVVLDLISNGQVLLAEYRKTNKSTIPKKEINDEFIKNFDLLIDSLYQDFCNHISLNSNVVR